VLVTVADSGPDIPDGNKELIFYPLSEERRKEVA